MAFGDMWWARNTWTTYMPSVVTISAAPQGKTLSGTIVTGPNTIIGPLDGLPPPPWWFALTATYFLDRARMPSTGTPFVSMPSVRLGGGVAVAGGAPGKEGGYAWWKLTLGQTLYWNDEEIASTYRGWMMGDVAIKTVLFGKPVSVPQKRDFDPIFFNMDRSRDLVVDLWIQVECFANNTGIVSFLPLDLLIPPWRVFSLD